MSTPSAPSSTVPKPAVSALAKSNPGGTLAYQSDSDSDGQARGGRRARKNQFVIPLPTSTGLSQPAGQLLKGATDDNGNQKTAALLVGIKLDLEAEIHLTARVKGDICVGLY
ncbi:Fc.00g079360.m01.CDS01 [Cosmosporella sp. VM-42]